MALKDSFVREVLPYLMTTWCALTVLINIILGIRTLNLVNKQLSFTLVAQSFTIQFVVIDVIADLLLLIPAAIVSTTLSWILTDIGCQIYGMVAIFVYLVTFSILGMRCLERVLRIRNLELHRRIFSTPRRLAVFALSVWFLDLVISGIPLTGWTVITYDYYHSGCYPVLEDNLYHLIVVTFLGIGLTLILFIVSHIVIFNSLKSQTNMSRIEPFVIKTQENKTSLPRTSSQNWLKESDDSCDSDDFHRAEKTSGKIWLDKEKENKFDNHNGNQTRPERPKRSASYLNRQQSDAGNPENGTQDPIHKKLSRKHALYALTRSVFTHFGICLFVILFWMPYFVVAVCRNMDKDVFQGYYSLSLCFILVTFTIKPLIHYVRLQRHIKNKKTRVLQWHREIKRERQNAIHQKKIPRVNRPDDNYDSKDEGYDEESSIGFDDEFSDEYQTKKIAQTKILGSNQRRKWPIKKSTKGENGRENEKSNIKGKEETFKLKRKLKNRRKVKKTEKVQSIPVLNKRKPYRYKDSDSENSEWNEYSNQSEFEEEYIDETAPVDIQKTVKNESHGNQNENAETKTTTHVISTIQNSKYKTEESEKTESSDKYTKASKQDNVEKSSEEILDDVGAVHVHIAAKTGNSKPVSMSKTSEKKLAKQNGMKQNDIDNHVNDCKIVGNQNTASKEYNGNAQHKSVEYVPREEPEKSHAAWTDKSTATNKKADTSSSKHKNELEGIPRSKSDTRRSSELVEQDTKVYLRNERRKTYNSLDTNQGGKFTSSNEIHSNDQETIHVHDERNSNTNSDRTYSATNVKQSNGGGNQKSANVNKQIYKEIEEQEDNVVIVFPKGLVINHTNPQDTPVRHLDKHDDVEKHNKSNSEKSRIAYTNVNQHENAGIKTHENVNIQGTMTLKKEGTAAMEASISSVNENGDTMVRIPLSSHQSSSKHRSVPKEKTNSRSRDINDKSSDITSNGRFDRQQLPEQTTDVNNVHVSANKNNIPENGDHYATHPNSRHLDGKYTYTRKVSGDNEGLTESHENDYAHDSNNKPRNLITHHAIKRPPTVIATKSSALNKKVGDQTDIKTNTNESLKPTSETSSKTKHSQLPSLKYGNRTRDHQNRKSKKNGEEDLSKVFINKDELPSQGFPNQSSDVKLPPCESEVDHDAGQPSERKVDSLSLLLHNSKPASEQAREQGGNRRVQSVDNPSTASVTNTPRRTINVYDPDEAAPISARSMDSKPSQNWYKMKSKVTSYVNISKKDKFSSIHGEDNAYDRSGTREISITHIKDDSQLKAKLAEVHLM